MLHPILSKRFNTLIYVVMWILIGGIHISALYFNFHLPFAVSLADVITFNSLYALFLLSIWFVVRFSRGGKNILLFTLMHAALCLLSAVILIILSLFTTRMLLGAQFNSDYYFGSLSWRFVIGNIYYIIMVLIYYLIVSYSNLQQKTNDESHLKNMVKEAELNLLKNQINPHFLFNSLNSISSLTMSNPSKAQEMIIKLSEYMRYSLSQRDNVMTTFSNELENCMRYLEIEKSRFGKKMQYENIIEEVTKDCTLPVMLLQPLYENAVKHGVYESTDVVVIRTEARLIDNRLFIKIVNSFDPEATPRKGTGTGLRNIRERLNLIYNENWLLSTDKKDKHFSAELIIPQ